MTITIEIFSKSRRISISTRERIANDAEFERKHPRDKDGKFGSGGGSRGNSNRDYDHQIDRAIRGELSSREVLMVASATPKVYTNLGIPNKPMGLPQTTIPKATTDKHAVPINIIRRLPQLMEKPVMIFDSMTEPNSLVSLLPVRDMDGNYIVAVIKPTSGRYNIIPSIYGKENIRAFIQRNIDNKKLRYIKKRSS